MQEDMRAVPGGKWGIGRKESEASNPSIETPTGYEAAMATVVSQDIDRLTAPAAAATHTAFSCHPGSTRAPAMYAK